MGVPLFGDVCCLSWRWNSGFVHNIGTVYQTTQWSHPRKPDSSSSSWGQIFLYKHTSFDLLLKNCSVGEAFSVLTYINFRLRLCNLCTRLWFFVECFSVPTIMPAGPSEGLVLGLSISKLQQIWNCKINLSLNLILSVNKHCWYWTVFVKIRQQ